jgi:hypothetical protein
MRASLVLLKYGYMCIAYALQDSQPQPASDYEAFKHAGIQLEAL